MNYIQLGDTKIEISDETAANLKKQFGEPEREAKNGDMLSYITAEKDRIVIIPSSSFETDLICNSLRHTGIAVITRSGASPISSPITQKYIQKNYTLVRNVFDD